MAGGKGFWGFFRIDPSKVRFGAKKLQVGGGFSSFGVVRQGLERVWLPQPWDEQDGTDPGML